MSSIGWVITVRFTVFCNVHRPKCIQNEFTKNGRQRKVQYRGRRLNQSRQKGVRLPLILKGRFVVRTVCVRLKVGEA